VKFPLYVHGFPAKSYTDPVISIVAKDGNARNGAKETWYDHEFPVPGDHPVSIMLSSFPE